ncbi:hypothetical protein DACRYDRAFT_19327 [Dacryopinax primogenitus]|uniref:CRAL-TRIO domain-containing protein n=1 Tax=Dacryopinax primogenitus (strain DJM 731) TaxID=1858805 RepID=M5G6W0_DACPD|nr:uncharacterized protein DACRYDRAFT_19327 [Dacryopinax primogenitus]EJU05991.1 hypothetical protein DACRYDRAFT_19327 [Dacryopinax primogenitus]
MPPNIPKDPLSGHPGHLSPEQQHILSKFRTELEEDSVFVPERHDDATLLRFLRARKFDLAKAKFMITSCEEWRKDFGVDQLIETFQFPEKNEVDKIYPQYYHKTDKDGRPIYVERLGQLDLRKLYTFTTAERLLKRFVLEYEKFLTERLPACSTVVGHRVETSCTILDLQNVGIAQFYQVKDHIAQATRIGQDRYPECMGKFYIINAPWIFSTVWMVIKPWLDEVTVNKISILGYNYKDTLLQQIPAENLPADLGGLCQCPGGCSLSDAGPWNEKNQGVIAQTASDAVVPA